MAACTGCAGLALVVVTVLGAFHRPAHGKPADAAQAVEQNWCRSSAVVPDALVMVPAVVTRMGAVLC